MTTTYAVQVFQTDRADDVDDLRRAVAAELEAVGLHKAVAVAVTEAAPPSSSPSVAVFLGSEEAATDVVVAAEIDAALADGRVVIPVVHDLNRFSSFVPSILSFANGLEWRDADGLARLVRLLLEELGIEDSQRRVFISHKRDDGLGAAEQLHDRLTHAGFLPFIDRFAVRPGAGVQDAIADALEDHAFLLLLETPLAHTSDWVFDEVDYALSHTMGTLILQWPGGVTPVPGSNGLPRIPLSTSDLSPDEHGFDLLTPAALEEAVAAIEASHAQGLCRRRRMLIKSIEEAARAAGCSSCVPLPEWRLLVHNAGGATIVGTTPRLPTAHDLQHLDEARQSGETPAGAVLVHSARVLKPDLRSHLQWVAGERDLALTPENAIGRVVVALPIDFAPMQTEATRVGQSIFVSASIPDPQRWAGEFDALEITDAVVSLTRVFLTSGFHLVTAAHPTIAPLLMYVAAEFPSETTSRVTIYQSLLFEDVLPTATRRFEAEGVGSIIWTPAVEGDAPRPGEWERSLDVMRRQMLAETSPVAAAFVGGMEGIPIEHQLFLEMFPGRPTYPVGRPGGEARALVSDVTSPLRSRLRDDGTYTALWRAVVASLGDLI